MPTSKVFTRKCAQVLLSSMLCLMVLAVSTAYAQQLGEVKSVVETDNQFTITTADGALTKVCFYRPDVFRIWVGPNANLTDPASGEETPIVVYKGKPGAVQREGTSIP